MRFDGSGTPLFFLDDYRTAGRRQVSGGEQPSTALLARSSLVNGSRIKRTIDIVGGGLLLAFFAPAMAMIAALIWLEGGGPVLFRQERYGVGRSVFHVLKFRTMKVMEAGSDFRQATRGDARLTRIGAILRRSSLDELPQLINVLRGEMSLVGPRPHALGMDDTFAGILPGYVQRHLVKPGLTGWAQIEGYRGPTEALEAIQGRLRYDRAYIRKWTPLLDLKILLKTPLRLFALTAF